MKTNTYKNVSGKYLQHELRLSDVTFAPGEVIELEYPFKNGYIVRLLDYAGDNRFFETAYISNNYLIKYFKPME